MIYLTSDQHFSHTNIIRYSNRPYKDTVEMNKTLIDNFNSTVLDSDEIYHLGDFSFNYGDVKNIVPQLKGKNYFIIGNHDLCFDGARKKDKRPIEDYIAAGFKAVYATVEVDDYVLNHFPYYYPDEPYARYIEYRLPNNGKKLLHGHIHNLWKKKDNMVNVGVDVWNYKPVSMEEINALF